MTGQLDAVYRRSLDDPEGFWAEAAEDVRWDRRWDRVLDSSKAPFYRWFTGATCNTCFNAVDRHVEEGRGEQPAIIYDSPVTGDKRTLTYGELQVACARFAGVLRGLGVGKGDRVVIYMPMVPEAVIAMLGCARIGAVHSVVFGGFAPRELATRIDDAKPTAIVTASCGIEPTRTVAYKPMVDEAIAIAAHEVAHVVVVQRDQQPCDIVAGRDVEWGDGMAAATSADCVPVLATDPLYILYTSGTTGQPKGIVRDNGGHLVALKWSMGHIYGVAPGGCVLGRLRHRLGGRPLLHRLRAAVPWLHHDPVRRQARRHARCGRLLAGHRRAWGQRHVHRADGAARDQA